METGIKHFFAGASVILLVSLISISCGKGKSTDAIVSFYSGTATIQTSNEQPRPIQMQDIVKDGDMISTGDKSSVIVQVGEELVIRFEANTNVVISSIKDIAKREITLEKGRVLSSVSKLKKGNEYSVKTPTAVASVRGTHFLTGYNDGKTVVAVGKGAVSVVKSDNKEEIIVETGKSALVNETIELRELNRVETLELKKLESTPVIVDIEKITLENLKKKFEEASKATEEINKEIESLSGNAGMSFDEMKAKYNRIDVVTMYNGKVIKGVIINRGTSLKIITPGGVITVQAKDIQRTALM